VRAGEENIVLFAVLISDNMVTKWYREKHIQDIRQRATEILIPAE
jgi:hypothetical protein